LLVGWEEETKAAFTAVIRPDVICRLKPTLVHVCTWSTSAHSTTPVDLVAM
jgi:hypothetical protein